MYENSQSIKLPVLVVGVMFEHGRHFYAPCHRLRASVHKLPTYEHVLETLTKILEQNVQSET